MATTARRRMAVAAAIALAATWTASGAPSARAQVAPPVVTVAATGARAIFDTDCRGESRTTYEGQVSFTVSRTGDTTAPLEVAVSRFGDLTASLPDPVSIPAGAPSITYVVDPATGHQGSLTILPVAGYTIGDPGRAEASVSAMVADRGCNLGIVDRYEETIARGTRPTDLDLAEEVGPVSGLALELDGTPPAGLTFRSDGRWVGAATEAGTTVFTAYYCDDDGVCGYELEVTIHVVDDLTATPRPSDPSSTAPPPAATPIAGSATFTG